MTFFWRYPIRYATESTSWFFQINSILIKIRIPLSSTHVSTWDKFSRLIIQWSNIAEKRQFIDRGKSIRGTIQTARLPMRFAMWTNVALIAVITTTVFLVMTFDGSYSFSFFSIWTYVYIIVSFCPHVMSIVFFNQKLRYHFGARKYKKAHFFVKAFNQLNTFHSLFSFHLFKMKFEMCVLLLSFIVCLVSSSSYCAITNFLNCISSKWFQGLASGRNIAESRLTKEFRRISESELVRSNAYSVELVKGSIYNWNVELRSIDEDSELYEDLQILKEIEGKDSILLNIKFTKEFPFTAPLVRIVCPAIASMFNVFIRFKKKIPYQREETGIEQMILYLSVFYFFRWKS